ncbi:MAG TPA: aminotransferase class V-fold PLP-dependent enzyme, partial [Candidatus Saccharimonadia bacterium]|nr:aminotransferase class V-fold PLP-dependent enzyme [Candidatus Saccharimonadia bacterium]
VDYTCAAPYLAMNMHPENPLRRLDAIYFSPHKFLGGPGTPGILIFNRSLYHNTVPDRPGGTPPFLGVIKAALAVRLKERMGLPELAAREEQIVASMFNELAKIPGLTILDGGRKKRLAVFAFTINGLHYNLITRLLNDRSGIQVRGGCACAGTYGHCLFKIAPEESKAITDKIEDGDLSSKPGFARVSLHPMMDNRTISRITSALHSVAIYGAEWAKDYQYSSATNEFMHKNYVASPAENLFTV